METREVNGAECISETAYQFLKGKQKEWVSRENQAHLK